MTTHLTPEQVSERYAGRVSTWTDPDSGCRYVVMSHMLGFQTGLLALAPKYRPDGSVDCGR